MKIVYKQHDRDFVILNLTDPQLSDEEWTGENDTGRTIVKETVRTLVERVHPDLITITGDLSWADHFTACRRFGAFLDELEIPWAPVWGNHDQEHGMAHIERVVEAYKASPYCVYEAGDPSLGNGNYVIGISENDRIVAGLLMMDSHNRLPFVNNKGEETTAYAKLSTAQLDWYEAEIKTLAQMGCKSTAMLLHIPIYAYRLAFEEWKTLPDTKEAVLDDRTGFVSPQGVCFEGICSYPEEDGVFAKIKALDSTKLVVAGHDHVNNAMFDYQGVKLVYALKTGLGCYWHPTLNGGTVISVAGDGTMTVRHAFVSV